jgi:hypothetical protein
VRWYDSKKPSISNSLTDYYRERNSLTPINSVDSQLFYQAGEVGALDFKNFSGFGDPTP